MKIPADTTCIVTLIIDCLFEEREVMDFTVDQPADFPLEDFGIDIDEIDLSQIFALDEDGVFVPIESGVYKYKCAINAETDTVTVLEYEKLGEFEADTYFSDDMSFIPDASL